MKATDIGLAAFGFAQIIFVLLPWLDRSPTVAPANRRPYFKYWFWTMLVVLIILSIFGKLPPTGTNAWIGFYSSITFIVMFLALPFITKKEAQATEKANAEKGAN
jgi:ubiquinol-cytochrome c reductase cytochrome b subunit